jgi:integration host factor subunit beta
VSGNRVEIRGFGTFSVKHRNQRIGRNPKTGKSIQIDKKYHPYFRSSKLLKETLNK